MKKFLFGLVTMLTLTFAVPQTASAGHSPRWSNFEYAGHEEADGLHFIYSIDDSTWDKDSHYAVLVVICDANWNRIGWFVYYN